MNRWTAYNYVLPSGASEGMTIRPGRGEEWGPFRSATDRDRSKSRRWRHILDRASTDLVQRRRRRSSIRSASAPFPVMRNQRDVQCHDEPCKNAEGERESGNARMDRSRRSHRSDCQSGPAAPSMRWHIAIADDPACPYSAACVRDR